MNASPESYTPPLKDEERPRARRRQPEHSPVSLPEVTPESVDPARFDKLIDRLSTLTNHGKILSQELTRAQQTSSLTPEASQMYVDDLQKIQRELVELQSTMIDNFRANLTPHQQERLAYFQKETDTTLAWIQSLVIKTGLALEKQEIPVRKDLPPIGSIYSSYRPGPSREYASPQAPPPEKPKGFFSRVSQGWSNFWSKKK